MALDVSDIKNDVGSPVSLVIAFPRSIETTMPWLLIGPIRSSNGQNKLICRLNLRIFDSIKQYTSRDVEQSLVYSFWE